MTFEDAIAYSRNVVAAKVALRLGEDTRESSTILHSTWSKMGFGSKTGIDLAGEVGGLVNDPTITGWQQIDLANGSFGQGVAVTPIQLATAFSAMVNGGTLVQPHVVKSIGTRRPGAGEPRPGHRAGAVGHADLDDAPRRHRGPVLPRPHADQGLRRRRQDRHGPDLGPDRPRRAGRLEAQPLQLQLRRLHRPRRKASPTSSIAVKINEGTPSVARVGQLEMPVMSFELFRRIATDAITRPGLLPERRAADHGRRGRRPVRGPYATLERVTDPATPSAPFGDVADPRLTAEDLVEATGGRLLARSQRPILGGAVDSREVVSGNLFVALPGERVDGHAFVGDALAKGAAAAIVARPPDGVPLDSVDASIVQVDDPLRALHAVAASWRRRFDPLVVGVTGSIAKTSTKEAIATVLGVGAGDAQERGQPEQRDRPAADRAPAPARPPGRGPRDGHVRRRRDRRAGRDRAARRSAS